MATHHRSEAALKITDVDGLRFITFDRPERANALTVADLGGVVDAITDPPAAIGGVVFAGAGQRNFSAGMDLATFRDLDPDRARTVIGAVRDALTAVRTSTLPTAAMVRGACVGAAFELALACDVRIATSDARFGLPEVKIGIPSVADAALLQLHVGLSLAKEMILTGDLYSVAQLDRSAMINRVVDADELRPTTVALVGRMTIHTRSVLASQKRLFETWINTPHVEGIEASVEEFAGLFALPETLEAVERSTRPKR